MATLYMNDRMLTWNSDQIQFSNEGIPVLVGLYPINQGYLSEKPTSNLCPDKTYALRIGIPDLEVIGPGLFLTSNGSQFDAIPPDEISGLYSSNGLTTFRTTVETPILLNRSFSASLGLTMGSYRFGSPQGLDPALVGYTGAFPTMLNSCQICGCSGNKICGSNGVCSDNPARAPCPDSVPCGFNQGRCSGGCPKSGYHCSNNNGYYSCVRDNFYSWIWAIIALLIIALILIFLLIRPWSKVPVIPMEPSTVIGPFKLE